MNPTIKSILAVLTGIVLGSIVNMGIITISSSVIPPPEGADLTTMEGLKSSMQLMEPKHFIMPFLAHAFGTFAGALVAALIAVNNKMLYAILISIVFLAGGIANVIMLPAPISFCVLDLAGAYIPMGYIAGKLAVRKQTA
jgi:hypothetical protein